MASDFPEQGILDLQLINNLCFFVIFATLRGFHAYGYAAGFRWVGACLCLYFFWTGKKKVFITERSMLVPLASTDSAEWGLTSQSERDAVRFPSDERIQKNRVSKSPIITTRHIRKKI